ncbi:MAG: hypothetical protein N2049_00655, partial [Anaerolineales bacterium]|nr:hypothetical protein [Anaerolineales bacterium]
MMQSAHPFGYFALSFLVLALWLAGCHLPQTATPPVPAQDWLGTSVAATMTAIVTAQAPQDIPTQAILFTPTPFPTMTKAVTEPPLFTSTPVKTNTPERGLGSISGAIVGYPFGGTPRFT